MLRLANAPSRCRPATTAMKKTSRDAQVLIDNLVTAVLLFDDRLRLRLINGAAEDLLSVSARQAIGLPLARLVPDVPFLQTAVPRAQETGQTFTERDVRLRGEQGQQITVDCTVRPIADDRGAEVLVELINVDRHHRIVREESMLNHHQVSSALIRGMAHEVKNPLGGIRGAAQLLQRQLEDEGQREYTRIIIQEADRLHKLIDSMLGPNRPPSRIAYNVHEVVEHVLQLVEAESPGAVAMVRDYDPSLPDLIGDPDHLVQAFLNIVRNAVQALQGARTPDGQILLRTRPQRLVTIGHRLHRLVVRVDVTDNGPGIPRELEEAIFFPMISGREGGSGLGLPLAQALVHRQGGLIAFDSRPGLTTFSVWLPIEAQP